MRPKLARLLAILTVLLGLGWLLAMPEIARASAPTCTVSASNLTVGTISPTSGYPYTTSASFSFTCTNHGASSQTVYACVSIDSGNIGTAADRRIADPGDNHELSIQITGGSNSPGQIGTGSAYPMLGPLTLTLPAGSGQTNTQTFSIVATLPQPGYTPPAATYSDSWSGWADLYFQTTAASSCGGASGWNGDKGFGFTISAVVPAMCSVTATSLAFPSVSFLTSPTTGTATVHVTCNGSTSVVVSLDNGQSGTGPTARVMKYGGGSITYGI